MFTWGFFLVCLVIVIAAAVLFWLIETKLFNEDPTLKKWARNIVALVCIVILIYFIINIAGGHINLNGPVIR